jgi:hypothetical protein
MNRSFKPLSCCGRDCHTRIFWYESEYDELHPDTRILFRVHLSNPPKMVEDDFRQRGEVEELLHFHYTWGIFVPPFGLKQARASCAKRLITVFVMAERGGFEPPLGCLVPKTV